ncbi:MAG: aminoacyl-tRNA deacylase [Chloroflexia bacterium]
MEKSNVMRLLEARGIAYEAFSFSPEIHSARGVAEVLGVPAHIVYKTLVVVSPEGRPFLVLIPGNRELDLRRLARSLGLKKVRMATQKEAERWTGLQVGGISPLALLGRGFRVYVDRSALDLEHIFVSAGRRGLNLRLRVSDLLALTAARPVEASAEGGGVEE